MAIFFLIPAKEKSFKDNLKQALQCLQLPQSSRQRTKRCRRVSRFSKIWQRSAHRIRDSAHWKGTNRISNSIDIPQLPLAVLQRMCFGLGIELFTMNDWSYGGFSVLPRLRFIISLRIPLPWTLTFTLTQFFVCNRFAVTKLIQYASTAVHKPDVFQNPCMKRTSSITCNITVHEMRAYCRKLWTRLVMQMFLHQYYNEISLPVVCVVSLNVSMHTKRFNDLLESTHVHRFIEIQNPSREVCFEYILFLKWSRDHNHWSVRSLECMQAIACVASVPVRAERNLGPRDGVFAFIFRASWMRNSFSLPYISFSSNGNACYAGNASGF